MVYHFFQFPGAEMVEVVAKEPTNLSGAHQFSDERVDVIFYDVCRILRKVSSKRQEDGTYQEWYEVDSHYQIIDRNPKIDENHRTATAAAQAAQESADTLEDAMCNAEMDTADWRAEIENAICELEEGGTEE